MTESYLLQFIAAHLGQPNMGDTGINRGQCVGLIEVLLDDLRLPHIWGNAKDLMANADRAIYTVIPNGPTNAPLPGDIVCWGASWGGGYGHTAIAVIANSMHLVTFEQNNPAGSPPIVTTHDYAGVEGWIRLPAKG